MDKQLLPFITMLFFKQFLKLRKDHKQTKQEMADQAQTSIEILKKIALAFNVTADWLIFKEGERELPNNLQLKFEAVSQMSEEDQRAIQSIIDGMILKHTANSLSVSSSK